VTVSDQEIHACGGPVADPVDAVPIASLPLPALLLRGDGTIVTCNGALCRLLSTNPCALNDRRIDDILFPLEQLIALHSDPREEEACHVLLPSGGTKCVEVGIGSTRLADCTQGYIVLLRDVSRSEETRRERDRLLNIAGVGSVLPTLLHEIRTPLASITATVEVLMEEIENPSVRDPIYAVLTEVRRMRLSLDGVLTVGRSLCGHRYAAIDLVCRHAWQVMASRARSLGLYSRCEVDDMPLLLLDPGVVGGIVHNLMINSIQACSPGQAVNLEAGLHEHGTRFTLTVVDNGCGMTHEVYARCTELFFTTKRNGSGIGLALCRRVVEEAGGTMTIESVLGFGTSVSIAIPIGPPDSTPHLDEPSSHNG
jgi:signal transduction histidine kinase